MWWEDQVNGTAEVMLPAVRESGAAAATATVTGDALPDPTNPWQWWWRYSRHSALRFASGIAPPTIDVFGPVLDDDEDGLLEAEMTYGRLYGGDGDYRRNDLFVVARPAVMVGAMAANAVVNHRRRVAARREAEVRWRELHPVRVWATTYRLICDTERGIVSFYYGAATEFYPDLESWSMTMGFGDECPPLRLSGPAAPAICLWAGTAILGNRWRHDPRLASLVA